MISMKDYLPERGVTWQVYITLVVIFLFHSIDVTLTLFAVTLGYTREGNPILIAFIDRMGIVLALFAVWIIGLTVVIFVGRISLWFEQSKHYFPAPTIILLTFLIFTAFIKIVVVVWNGWILLT